MLEKLLNPISSTDKLFFVKHLAVMIKSGLPISESLFSLADQTANPYFKSIISEVSKNVDNGQTLSSSLRQFPDFLPPVYINLIALGESSGNLEANLALLADQLKKEYAFRQKIVAASMYPTIVLLTTIIIGGGISLFVLPKIIDLFSSFGTKLPLATQILIGISILMRDHGYLIIGSFISIIFLCKLAVTKIKPVAYIWQLFLLTFPLTSRFNIYAQMVLFCRNLGLMIKSGLPLNQALSEISQNTSNPIFAKYFLLLKNNTEEGKSLSSTFSTNHPSFLPPITAKMISVGEKSGRLDESLLYLADFFEEELDNLTKNISTVLEPILLIVIGSIVAFVALAIISPIYQFTASIGHP